MDASVTFRRWDTGRKECCALIAGARATLKILLKTRNDPFFLERWILHHRKIAGEGNVIVFDNMSDDQAVIDILHKYKDVAPVVRFPGFCNWIHDVSAYAELYRALGESADYFVFLDTDEFLVLFDGDKYFDGPELVDFIRQHDTANVFPATWLHNADWSAVRYRCGSNHDSLANGIAWGKPVLRSKSRLTGFINHNIQLDQSLFAAPIRTNFFALHMTKLSPKQRISANVNKLIALRVARPGDSAETICSRKLEGMPSSNAIRYIMEIRDLLSMSAEETAQTGPLGAGCLELSADHSIQYYSERERALVNGLIDDPISAYGAAAVRATKALQRNEAPDGSRSISAPPR